MNQFTQIQQFSEQELEIISRITTEILVEYQNQGNLPNLKEFCNILIQNRETIKDKDSILKDIDSAFETIDLANEYQKDLIASQKKGQSKLNWLKSTIKSIFKVDDAREMGKIIQEVQSALAKVNNQHLNLIVEEELRSEQKTQALSFTESNKTGEASIYQDVTSIDLEYTVSQTTILQETDLESFSDDTDHNGIFVEERVEVNTSSENYSNYVTLAEISENFSSENDHIIFEHHNESIQESVNVYTSMEVMPFEGINQQMATGELLNELQDNSLLSSIAFAQQVTSISTSLNLNTNNPFEIVKNYFESDLESNDTTLIKLSTLGLLIGKHEHLGILRKLAIPELAIVADSGLFTAKVMHKLAQGKLRHDQAIEKLSEKVIAGSSALLQQAVKRKSQLVGVTAGAMIGSAFGPVGTVVGGGVGFVAGKLAGDKICEGIKSGAKKVAKEAKKIVRKTVESAKVVSNVVKSGVTTFANKTKGLLKKIFSW